jgi:hypothetical protein
MVKISNCELSLTLSKKSKLREIKNKVLIKMFELMKDEGSQEYKASYYITLDL